MYAVDLDWPAYLVSTIAIVAISVLLLVVRGIGQSKPPTLREKIRRSTGKPLDAIDDRQDHWAETAERSHDRRQRVRRGGKLTPIRVTTAPTAHPVESDEGLVLDRSSRGLCIATEGAYEVGEVIFILAVAALPDIPWVAATVRNCRTRDGYLVIGCEFKQTPPWTVLLLFG